MTASNPHPNLCSGHLQVAQPALGLHPNIVILRLSDEDSRRTSTSALFNRFNQSNRSSTGPSSLLSAICYLIASYRLLITDY
jgi:hypothetical protein